MAYVTSVSASGDLLQSCNNNNNNNNKNGARSIVPFFARPKHAFTETVTTWATQSLVFFKLINGSHVSGLK